jgi:acyl CoA:acetate/3-ketoacid CoA transferase
MAFRPQIAPELKTMDARIFCAGLMGLKEEAGK